MVLNKSKNTNFGKYLQRDYREKSLEYRYRMTKGVVKEIRNKPLHFEPCNFGISGVQKLDIDFHTFIHLLQIKKNRSIPFFYNIGRVQTFFFKSSPWFSFVFFYFFPILDFTIIIKGCIHQSELCVLCFVENCDNKDRRELKEIYCYLQHSPLLNMYLSLLLGYWLTLIRSPNK